jgi:gliding motility-associated-like protein
LTPIIRCLFFILIIILPFSASSQKEWSNWYANSSTKLSFKNGNAEVVKDFIAEIPPFPPFENLFHFYHWAQSPITSYSDPVTGEMLLAISNHVGFGKNYWDFPTPDFLRSCPDKRSYQIIPIPDKPGKFYIMQFQSIAADLAAQETGLQVRCPNAIGLGYSIADLSLNNGMGDFSTVNKVLSGGLTEQITYVRHANGKDVWIIVHPYGSANYQAILATSDGFNAPVVSTIGAVINGGSRSVYGLMEASHDGKLLAVYRSIPLANGRQNSDLELFDFDNATGKLSNYRTKPNDGYISGIQFSPDNSKLYAVLYSQDYDYSKLVQWDFNQPDFEKSKTIIYERYRAELIDMQLGPDGKIYISRHREYYENDIKDYLMVIQCPNLPQFACNLKIRGPEITMFYLPVLINDFINSAKVAPIPKFSLGNDTAICFGTYKLSAPAGWESYQWNTGDTTREITINKTGTYYVLTGNTGFSCPSGYGSIIISDQAKKLDLGKDSGICAGSSIPIKIPDGYINILWPNGSQTRDSLISGGGEIIISAKDLNGCFTKDTINIFSKYFPRANFGNDTVLCNNEKLILRLEPIQEFSPTAVYKWQDSTTKANLVVTKPGTYWGTVSFDGCTVSDTIKVSYLNTEQVSLGADTTLCKGDTLLLSPSVPGASYQWSNGATTPLIYAHTGGTYWVKVDNGLCVLSDTIQVNFTPKPSVFLGKDTAVCVGERLVLNPNLTGGKFLWQDGATTANYTVSKEGLYWLHYSFNGCTVGDSIRVNYLSLPPLNLGRDTTFCAEGSFLLSAADTSINHYLWQNQGSQPFFRAVDAGTYHVVVTGKNGCLNRDTIILSTVPLPKFSLGADTSLCTGSTLVLNPPALSGAAYAWSTGSLLGQQALQQSGTYWLKADRQGCTFSDTISVYFKPNPQVNLGRDTSLCEGSGMLLTVNQTGAGFTWQNGTTANNLSVNKAGLYYVTVDLDNCLGKDSIRVSYLDKPVLLIGQDTSICLGQKITLTPTVNTSVSYRWQDGSTQPSLSISDTGFYTVSISNVCGNQTRNISVSSGLCQILMPDAFTPNGDLLNDVFRVKYPFRVNYFRFQIYNRYGTVIFETDQMLKGWDGKVNGQLASSGNYIWVIKVENSDGKTHTYKGSVVLMR